jgi:hypothetical protein
MGKSSKQNKTFNNKCYTFERVEHFKYLGVISNENNNQQIDLQEGIKNANNRLHNLCCKKFSEIKIYLKRKNQK